jgi:hypothetical protein
VNDPESFPKSPEPFGTTFNYVQHIHLKTLLVFKVAVIYVVPAKHVSSEQAY